MDPKIHFGFNMMFHILYLPNPVGELLQVAFQTLVSVEESGRSLYIYDSCPIKEYRRVTFTNLFKHIVTYQTLEEYHSSMLSHLFLVQVSYRVQVSIWLRPQSSSWG
jgi:hypothetical protein